MPSISSRRLLILAGVLIIPGMMSVTLRRSTSAVSSTAKSVSAEDWAGAVTPGESWTEGRLAAGGSVADSTRDAGNLTSWNRSLHFLPDPVNNQPAVVGKDQHAAPLFAAIMDAPGDVLDTRIFQEADLFGETENGGEEARSAIPRIGFGRSPGVSTSGDGLIFEDLGGGPLNVAFNDDVFTEDSGDHGLFVTSRGPDGANGDDSSVFQDSSAGDPGVAGGQVIVSALGEIQTTGNDAAGIVAQSLGGTGGIGGDASLYFNASTGGGGGLGGDVTVSDVGSVSAQIDTGGENGVGILALSQGGNGGNGGDGGLGLGAFPGGPGGMGGSVLLDGNWNITTNGSSAIGIWAKSVGGGAGAGGAGGWTGTSAASGGQGAVGGSVNVQYAADGLNGEIRTQQDDSHGIYAESIGGFGGAGGNSASIFVAYGGSGESAGSGGEVIVGTGFSVIETDGGRSHGIFAQSVGGGGGSGGDGGALLSLGGTGQAGGLGGNVEVTSGSTIRAEGAGSRGIFAQSVGGGGGDGGDSVGLLAVGGQASATSNGGTVAVDHQGNLINSSSSAIFAQSIGGGGGNGGSSEGWFSMGGSGGGGGDAEIVTVIGKSNLTTTESNSSAIFAQSLGGGGGNGGGSTAVGPLVAVAVGGSAASGGDGSLALVGRSSDGFGGFDYDWFSGVIRTEGENSHGIQAQSVGGGGGNGGFARSVAAGVTGAAAFSFGGSGGGGGDGDRAEVWFGDVYGFEGSSITTTQDNSNGIFAQSVGGGGGSGGMSIAGAVSGGYSAGLSFGGNGGAGGRGGAVDANSLADIRTEGEHSYGILAQSVGGGGGNGGLSIAGSIGSAAGVSLAFGGDGALGGRGGTVSIDGRGAIETLGNDSHAVFAQSVGGGGGSGGGSIAGSLAGQLSVTLGFGGNGGGGGTAGNIGTFTEGTITTRGERSYGVLAQSVGGGGGDGGFSVAGGLSGAHAVNFSMGGAGGSGGDGRTVSLNSDGQVLTIGNDSHGLLGQSVGGGGGSGGLSVAGGISGSTGVNVALGGSGGSGGEGEFVILRADGSSITTRGDRSFGILGQSVGGGGGNGGFSIAGGITTSGGGAAVSASLGGSGGSGGDSGQVVIQNLSAISTGGINGGRLSHGIVAQSVGGGGGTGGFNVAGAVNSPSVSFGIGGTGGTGGSSGRVDVDSGSTITTLREQSSGILAQSIGGGGGAGGLSVTGSLSSSTTAVSYGVGGFGGDGGSGGTVVVGKGANISGLIQTSGSDSAGIIAESIGGGGGDGGLSIAGSVATAQGSKSLAVAVGGLAGSGNDAGTVTVNSEALIQTGGDSSSGIVAHSIGGGGGTGGLSVAGAVSLGAPEGGTSLSLPLSIGGQGGEGNAAGAVTVNNSGNITTGVAGSGIGNDSKGILATSIGGGGGNGGNSLGIALGLESNSKGKNIAANVTLGGVAGSGGLGGAVHVVNDGLIATHGSGSTGIQAQSIGGGGGNGGTARGITVLAKNSDDSGNTLGMLKDSVNTPDGATQNKKNNYSFQLTIGGDGGNANHAGAVDVDNTAQINTTGDNAEGVVAQSIGGGGGNGGQALRGTGTSLDRTLLKNNAEFKKKIAITVGGSAGSSGDGKAVDVAQLNSVSTQGLNSHGILAQSIGGGGGKAMFTITNEDVATGGTASSGATGTIGLGGAGGAAGNGGAVNVTMDGAITTIGDGARGIIAQSIGGGGGMAGDVDRAAPDKVNVGVGLAFARDGGGAGNGNNVIVSSDGDISTTGTNADGIFAQSVGGGGGLAGGTGIGVQDVVGLGGLFAGSVGGSGSAGVVAVDHTGSITTTNTGANGIWAQSAAGQAVGGAVLIDFAGGNILVDGADADGIFAQSRGDAAQGDIAVTIASGTVQGGSGSGAGVRLVDGKSNRLTNYGSILNEGGIDGMAIMSRQVIGDLYETDIIGADSPELVAATSRLSALNTTVDNFGTVTGNIDFQSETEVTIRSAFFPTTADTTRTLSNGLNIFNNITGAVLNSGTEIHLGAGSTLRNAGTIAPGGVGTVRSTALTGNYLQIGNAIWDFDLESGLSDSLAISGTASLGVFLNRIDINAMGPAAVPGTYTLLSAVSGLTGNFEIGEITGAVPIGNTYGLINSDTAQQLTLAASTGAFHWSAAIGSSWKDAFVNGQTNWTSDAAGANFILGTPGEASDVFFSSATVPNADQTTVLDTDFSVNSLTFNPSIREVGVQSGAGGPNTLTLSGAAGTGIKVMSGAALVTIGADLMLADGSDTITVGNAAGALITGGIGGSNSLIKTGTGRLTVAGTSSHTGVTTVSGGTLLSANEEALGTTPFVNIDLGAALAVNFGGGSDYSAAQVDTLLGKSVFASGGRFGIDTSNAAGPVTYDLPLALGAGALRKLGDETLILSADSSYESFTEIFAGTLQVGDGTSGNLVGSAGFPYINVLGGGVLAMNLGDGGTFVRPIYLNGVGTSLDAIQAGTNTISGSINFSGAFNQNGTGTTILTGATTYTGVTTVNDGTLQLGNGVSNGVTAYLGSSDVTINNGGTLAVNLEQSGFAGAAGRDWAVGVGGRISGNNGSGTSQTIASNITGAGSFHQEGSGTTFLTGLNTYTGETRVDAGFLVVGNGFTGNLTGTSGVIVAAGANLNALLADGATFVPNIELNGSSRLFLGQSGVNTFSGDITGTGIIDQYGGGKTILTGANSHTGATLVELDSSLQIGDGASGNLTGGGSVLVFGASEVLLNLADGAEFAPNINLTTPTARLEATQSGTLDLSSPVVGSGSFTASSGTTVLSGSSPYTGKTIVEGGATLQIGDGVSGNLTGTSVIEVSSTLAMNLADGGTLQRDVFLRDPGAVFEAIQDGTNTYAGGTGIQGAGDFIQSGTGLTLFTGDNSLHTGETIINAGTLQSAKESALGGTTSVDVFFGGTLAANLGGSSDYTKAQLDTLLGKTTFFSGRFGIDTSNATGPITYNFPVVDPNAGLTKLGSGTLILDLNNNNRYALETVIEGGTLQLGNGGTQGALRSGKNIINNGTLAINRNNIFNFNMASSAISGTGDLNQNGPGATVLDGFNTYTGETNINAGALWLNSPTALGSTDGGTNVADGASLDLNGWNYTLAEPLTLAGSGAGSNRGALVNRQGFVPAAFAGPITLAETAEIGNDGGGTITLSGGVSAGAGADLIKVGNSQLILTGASSYTSDTLINKGYLFANNSVGSATGGGDVIVAPGGLLGGTGALSGNVTANGFSTIMPGPSLNDLGGGILTVGDLVLNEDSNFVARLVGNGGNAGTDFGQLKVLGNAVINSARLVLDTLVLGAAEVGKQFDILDVGGTLTGMFEGLKEGGMAKVIDDVGFFITYLAGDGNDVALFTATPATPYELWAIDQDLTKGVNDGLFDDPNGDDNPNIKHFAFDTDPLNGLPGHPGIGFDEGKRRIAPMEMPGGGQVLTLTIPVRIGAMITPLPGVAPELAVDGIVYTVLGDADLAAPYDLAVNEISPPLSAGLPVTGPDYEYRTFQLEQTVESLPQGFLFLGVQAAP